MTPQHIDTRPLMPPRAVAERLGVTPKTVYRLLERGALPSHKIGRAVRVAPADLDDYLTTTRS